ncbi:MAG: type II toxin-antitoxin system VapB family antitoxin [Caldimonas sp.]
MRTNILIDDTVLEEAMRAGPFKTKKDAVDAGLRLLARQAAYREILRYEGKLRWDEEPAAASGRSDTASVRKPASAARTPRAKR